MSSVSLGTWEGDDFRSTAWRTAGIGVNADLPDESRFPSEVVKLLNKRSMELERRGEQEDDDLAIFLLAPEPPETHANASWEPMLDNGRSKLIGRLWFTPAAVISAHWIPLPDGSDEVRFRYVTDELKLPTRPALIYEARTTPPTLRWYPCGLGQQDNVEPVALSGPVDPEDVFETINRIYHQCLKTPGSMISSGNLWFDARKHRASNRAEKTVQEQLKAGLAARFGYCDIRHEQTQPGGRTDLEIEERNLNDQGTIERHAVIELKVLRSYGQKGKSVSQNQIDRLIEIGVDQAAVYRNEKSFNWSALCCFDMRRDNDGDHACFEHVDAHARELQVELRRWFLFASAMAYRRHAVALGLI